MAISESGSAGKLAKMLGINRVSAYKRLVVLERKGFVKRVSADSGKVRTWVLTEAGEFLMLQLRRGFGNCNMTELLSSEFKLVYRAHFLMLKFKVVEAPEDLVKRLVGVGGFATKRGWKPGYEVHDDGTKVFFHFGENGRAINMELYPGKIFAGNVYDAADKVLVLGFRVARRMERAFPGLLLNGSYDLCRQHIAEQGGLAKWCPAGFNYRTQRLVIDFSEGKDKPEVEAVDKTFAFEDMHRLAASCELMATGEIDLVVLKEALERLTQATLNLQARQEFVEKRLGGVLP